MKIFLDTMIVIDWLGGHDADFQLPAQTLISLGLQNKLTLHISSLTFANTLFVMGKRHGKTENGRKKLLERMTYITQHFTILPVDSDVINLAMSSGWKDIEDAMQQQCAIMHGENIDYIVTRDQTGYENQDIAVVTAFQMVDIYIARKNET